MDDTFAERMKENNRRRSVAERSSPPERKEEKNKQTTRKQIVARDATFERVSRQIYEMPQSHLSITPLPVRASKANRELNSIRWAEFPQSRRREV